LVVISAFANSISCRASREVCSLNCWTSSEMEAFSALAFRWLISGSGGMVFLVGFVLTVCVPPIRELNPVMLQLRSSATRRRNTAFQYS